MGGGTAYLPRKPHPALAPYVISMAAYDMSLGAPGVHRGLPSPALTLVLPLGEAIDVGWSGAPATRAPRWSLLSGLHVAPAAIHHDGHQTGVQLMLTTSGARALLGLPAAALSRELVELDQLDAIAGAPQLRSLPERLHAEDDQEELLRLTETALLAGLSRHDGPGPRPEVARAQRALRHGIPVSEVAVEVGWSRRHLSEQFRAECGIGPKEYQRIARFQGSVRLLLEAGRAGRVRLADVAADAGYADQSHLTREWTALAGCTPTRWLAEEFPFVQDWRGEVDDDRP